MFNDYPTWEGAPLTMLFALVSFLLEPPLCKKALKKDFLEFPLRNPCETPESLFSLTRPVEALPEPLKLAAGRNLLFCGRIPVYA